MYKNHIKILEKNKKLKNVRERTKQKIKQKSKEYKKKIL
jgi:hypothetical protein